jgi:hypothetical protein
MHESVPFPHGIVVNLKESANGTKYSKQDVVWKYADVCCTMTPVTLAYSNTPRTDR